MPFSNIRRFIGYAITSYRAGKNRIFIESRRKHVPPTVLRMIIHSPQSKSADVGGFPLQHPPMMFSPLSLISPLPEQLEWHREDLRSVKLKDGRSVVENDSHLEITSRLGGESAQAIAI